MDLHTVFGAEGGFPASPFLKFEVRVMPAVSKDELKRSRSRSIAPPAITTGRNFRNDWPSFLVALL